MLIDTGCSHSVMPCDLYAKLDGDSKLQWRPPEGHGVLADGSQIPIPIPNLLVKVFLTP